MEIVAVSSQNRDKAEKLAAEVGARAVSDDRAIIEDTSIVAISNTLPTHLHAASTIAALEMGKHVLLEKPFALLAEDTDAITSSAKAANRTLMVAHVLRFWGEYVTLSSSCSPKDRQAYLRRGDPALAAPSLGRLVPESGVERRRGARSRCP